MRRSGDRPVDAGKGAAICLVPGPYFRRGVVCHVGPRGEGKGGNGSPTPRAAEAEVQLALNYCFMWVLPPLPFFPCERREGGARPFAKLRAFEARKAKQLAFRPLRGPPLTPCTIP